MPLRILAAIAATLGLAGCEISTPFKAAPLAKQPGAEMVLVAVTHAEVDPDKRKPFDEGTRSVLRTIHENKGLIGHSVRKEPFGTHAWTMTIWEDEESLEAFVSSPAHREAMRAGRPALVSAQFLRFEWPRNQVPPSWDEVKRRLEAAETVSYR